MKLTKKQIRKLNGLFSPELVIELVDTIQSTDLTLDASALEQGLIQFNAPPDENPEITRLILDAIKEDLALIDQPGYVEEQPEDFEEALKWVN